MERQNSTGLNSLKAAVLITLTALALSGCSSTKLAYQYADWGIIWWVDDYVPMTDPQQAQL